MKCEKKWMPLYAVTDRTWLGERTLREAVEEALRGGATCVQLREKTLDRENFLREAVELKDLCRSFHVPLIINDDVEIALRSGADGVHIGQHDAAAKEVRQRIGSDLLLGVSARTLEQALQAERDGADYLGVGAVFSTGTKLDAQAADHKTVAEICRTVNIPVVAIGGIKRENIPLLSGTGIDGVAVVSAIFAARDIQAAARALRETVGRELGV